jgi:hypothetical protein
MFMKRLQLSDHQSYFVLERSRFDAWDGTWLSWLEHFWFSLGIRCDILQFFVSAV